MISSSILGVGSAHRVKGVNWGTAKRMLVTWVITLPISGTRGSYILCVKCDYLISKTCLTGLFYLPAFFNTQPFFFMKQGFQSYP
ncbi:inorganic phosphate transporter [Bacillus sp. SL00103]